MSSKYDLVVSGRDGVDAPNPKTGGKNGEPLGPDGNGAPGEGGLFGCKKEAGVGQPGNRGWTAPSAESGSHADDAYAMILRCSSFEGTSFSVLIAGGKGGNGGDGGVGGDGSAGGDAGKQPKHCTEVINGGVGGNSGAGGTAGNGGCGGNGGDVIAVFGLGLSSNILSTTNHGGVAGLAGTPGEGGVPGGGGKNSDGTLYSRGERSGGGSPGTDGTAGSAGSLEASTDASKPPAYFELVIKPLSTPRVGCGA